MELWIRSQDKKLLIPINKMISVTCDGLFYDGIILGIYKTEERALEVLDEIHQRIINLQCIEITGADFISQQMKRNGIDCVYEMPKK